MSSIADFTAALHASHLDNGRMVYYAAKAGTSAGLSDIKPVMPATPFIFEYFLYNSIYQHDWVGSDKCGQLIPHGEATRKRGDEGEQQKRLLDEYLLPACQKKPQLLIRAFVPFQYIVDLNGKLTKIVPDSKLTDQNEEDFFESMRMIRLMIQGGPESRPIDAFVGKVRNNIFHGRKIS